MNDYQAYNQVEFADTISKAQAGGISNEVNSFDLITGNIENITYKDNSDQFKQLDSGGSPTNTSSFIRKHSRSNASRTLVPFSSDQSVTDRIRKIGILNAYKQNVTQNIVRIYIYGDSEIKAGDVIKCTFPSATTADDAGKAARLETGNYLVTKVRHMILNGDRPQHTIALEIIKGNFTEAS